MTSTPISPGACGRSGGCSSISRSRRVCTPIFTTWATRRFARAVMAWPSSPCRSSSSLSLVSFTPIGWSPDGPGRRDSLRPTEDTEFRLVFPAPRISHRIATVDGTNYYLYLGGEFGGGTWAIRREDGRDDTVGYNDLRLLLGAEIRAAFPGRAGGRRSATSSADRSTTPRTNPMRSTRRTRSSFGSGCRTEPTQAGTIALIRGFALLASLGALR